MLAVLRDSSGNRPAKASRAGSIRCEAKMLRMEVVAENLELVSVMVPEQRLDEPGDRVIPEIRREVSDPQPGAVGALRGAGPRVLPPLRKLAKLLVGEPQLVPVLRIGGIEFKGGAQSCGRFAPLSGIDVTAGEVAVELRLAAIGPQGGEHLPDEPFQHSRHRPPGVRSRPASASGATAFPG